MTPDVRKPGSGTFKNFLLSCIVGCFLPALIVGCTKGVVYDVNQLIPDEIWNKDKPVKFDVTVADTIKPKDFFLSIRNTTDYRFANLYLFIRTVFPDGKFARDTVECILATPEGKWLGKGISRLKENRILLKKGVRFQKKGIYHFEIEQAMREESLTGITDIGILIQEHK